METLRFHEAPYCVVSHLDLMLFEADAALAPLDAGAVAAANDRPCKLADASEARRVSELRPHGQAGIRRRCLRSFEFAFLKTVHKMGGLRRVHRPEFKILSIARHNREAPGHRKTDSLIRYAHLDSDRVAVQELVPLLALGDDEAW
jgi:hypothetical protein